MGRKEGEGAGTRAGGKKICDGRTSQVTGRGTEYDLTWDAVTGGKSGEGKDPNLTVMGRGAEKVAKELFAFKGLKKYRIGENMDGKKQKAPGGTYCSPESGMEPRYPLIFISSASSMWI